MNDILELLNEKNTFLKKFYSLNESEMQNFSVGNFDNLGHFYDSREGILDMIRRVDEMIDTASLSFEESDKKDAEATKQITIAMNTRNKIIERILEQDLEILSAIDQAKSEIIKDLAQTRVTKKAVSSYRSGQKTSKLNEEY